MWDATNGRHVSGFDFDSPIRCFAFEHKTRRFYDYDNVQHQERVEDDARPLATGCVNNLYYAYVRRDGRLKVPGMSVGIRSNNREITDLCVSHDSRWIAVSYDDGTVAVRGYLNGGGNVILTGHMKAVVGLAFSPDCKRLVSCSSDGTTKLWDTTQSNAFLRQTPPKQRIKSEWGWVEPESWVARGTTISGLEITSLVWPSGTGKHIAFAPDGRQIVCATADGQYHLLDATKRQESKSFKVHENVDGLAFSPNGKQVAIVNSGGLEFWDLSTGRKQEKVFQTHWVSPIAFSPDGQRVGIPSPYYIQLFDISTSDQHPVMLPPFDISLRPPSINCMAFSPDGKRIVCGDENATMTLWDVDRIKVIWTNTAHGKDGFIRGNSALVIHINRKVNRNRDIEIRNTTSGELMRTFTVLSIDDFALNAIKISPDGQLIATTDSFGRVKGWNSTTGHELFSFGGQHDRIRNITFSPDGRVLAASHSNGKVTFLRLVNSDGLISIAP